MKKHRQLDLLNCAAACFFAAEVVFVTTVVALFW